MLLALDLWYTFKDIRDLPSFTERARKLRHTNAAVIFMLQAGWCDKQGALGKFIKLWSCATDVCRKWCMTIIMYHMCASINFDWLKHILLLSMFQGNYYTITWSSSHPWFWDQNIWGPCLLFQWSKGMEQVIIRNKTIKIIHRYFPCNYRLHLWNIVEDSKCTYCNTVDTLNHYFAECQVVKGFWESVKRWFLRVFQFVINFTPLLGIPNYDNSNVIMNLNFVILFAKYFIYDCKKNDKPVDFYHFQVKLKTRMVIEEYRSELYNRKLDFLVKWSVLSDSLWRKSVIWV